MPEDSAPTFCSPSARGKAPGRRLQAEILDPSHVSSPKLAWGMPGWRHDKMWEDYEDLCCLPWNHTSGQA